MGAFAERHRADQKGYSYGNQSVTARLPYAFFHRFVLLAALRRSTAYQQRDAVANPNQAPNSEVEETLTLKN